MAVTNPRVLRINRTVGGSSLFAFRFVLGFAIEVAEICSALRAPRIVAQRNVTVKSKITPPPEAPFTKAIRVLRKALGETQEGMARRLGISLSGYRYWESGKRTPRGLWLLRLRELCPDPETRSLFGREIEPDVAELFPTEGSGRAAKGKSRWDQHKKAAIRAIEILHEKAASGDRIAQARLRDLCVKLCQSSEQSPDPRQPLKSGASLPRKPD